MSKLIEAYRANFSIENAKKIQAYERKHPMSTCFLSMEDAQTFANAIAHAKAAAKDTA